jgi:hypothetical protein
VRACALLLAACATAGPRLHLDLRTGDAVTLLAPTCAATFHVSVTDDAQHPAPHVPVHFEIESVERCMEETVARHTLLTELAVTDANGMALTCDPWGVTRDDPWKGIEGCHSVFAEPHLIVGEGSKQVIKAPPFADGMTVALRHGH